MKYRHNKFERKRNRRSGRGWGHGCITKAALKSYCYETIYHYFIHAIDFIQSLWTEVNHLVFVFRICTINQVYVQALSTIFRDQVSCVVYITWIDITIYLCCWECTDEQKWFYSRRPLCSWKVSHIFRFWLETRWAVSWWCVESIHIRIPCVAIGSV